MYLQKCTGLPEKNQLVPVFGMICTVWVVFKSIIEMVTEININHKKKLLWTICVNIYSNKIITDKQSNLAILDHLIVLIIGFPLKYEYVIGIIM